MKRNEELINKLVEEKINKMIPGILKQVTRAVEAKLIIEGCVKCQRSEIKSSLRKKNYHEI